MYYHNTITINTCFFSFTENTSAARNLDGNHANSSAKVKSKLKGKFNQTKHRFKKKI